MKPVLVTHDGRIVNTDNNTTPSQAETLAEASLDEIAAKEAERQSTRKHQ